MNTRTLMKCRMLSLKCKVCGHTISPCFLKEREYNKISQKHMYKACPSQSGTEVGAPLFPAVELCDFHGRWQFMSGEIWYTLDSGSVLLNEAEAR